MNNSPKEKKAVELATMIRQLEDELGRELVSYLNNDAKLNKIAMKSGVRTSYLIDVGMVGAGLKKRHRLAKDAA